MLYRSFSLPLFFLGGGRGNIFREISILINWRELWIGKEFLEEDMKRMAIFLLRHFLLEFSKWNVIVYFSFNSIYFLIWSKLSPNFHNKFWNCWKGKVVLEFYSRKGYGFSTLLTRPLDGVFLRFQVSTAAFLRFYDFKTNNPRDVLAIFSPSSPRWRLRISGFMSAVDDNSSITCVSVEKKKKKRIGWWKWRIINNLQFLYAFLFATILYVIVRKIHSTECDRLNHGDRKFNETIIDVVTPPETDRL